MGLTPIPEAWRQPIWRNPRTENAAGEARTLCKRVHHLQEPTGQVLWALIDGDAQALLNVQVGRQVYDLLAA